MGYIDLYKQNISNLIFTIECDLVGIILLIVVYLSHITELSIQLQMPQSYWISPNSEVQSSIANIEKNVQLLSLSLTSEIRSWF